MERNMEAISGVCQRPSDCEVLLSHLNHVDRQLQLKRRWLIGLPIRMSFSEDRSLPESFVREDDEFSDRIKLYVEKAFGHDPQSSGQQDCPIQLIDEATLRRILSSSSTLSSLTNEALHQICSLLSGGSVNFERTRRKMKKLIMASLPSSLKRNSQSDVDLIYGLSVLLNNPIYVKGNALSSVIPACSPRGAAMRILNRLEEMPTEVLLAMYRKLKVAPTGTLRLHQPRIGWNRQLLISKIRNISEKILSEIGLFDELPLVLARAMAIAHISSSGSLASEFDIFSSETKRLQMEIGKAISLIKTKVRMPELRTLQRLLDPNSNVSNGSLRTSLRKLLGKYLIECSEMDTIPRSLSEALDIINRTSRAMPQRMIIEEDIQKDVDSILNLSAQTKQIAWNLILNHSFDEDFSDAYIEELEESDECEDESCDYCLDNDGATEVRTSFNEQDDEILEISVGESIPWDDPQPSISRPPGCSMDSPLLDKTNCGTSQGSSTPSSPHKNQPSSQNLYLRVQDACDDTCMIAYKLIGRMIKSFALADGLDLDQSDASYLTTCLDSEDEEKDSGSMEKDAIVIQAVNDSFPALSNSTVDRLKDILGT